MPIKILNGIDVDNGVLYTDTSNNRVGINTSSPQVPLEAKYTGTIDEIVRIVGTASGKPQMTFYNDTTLHTKIVAAGNNDFSISNTRSTGDMFFSTGGTNRLHIEASGNVGVGTTDPVNKLNVNGDIGYIGVIGQGSIYGNTGNSSYANMQLYNPSTGYSTFNNQSYGYYFNTSGGTKLTILNNGNVGIGTTSPDYKLEVDGTLGVSRTDGIIFAGSAGSGQGNKITSDTSNNFIFSTSLVSSPYTTSERMRIANSGNVGIGISSPATKLHIGSDSTASTSTEELRMQSGTGGGFGGNAVLNLVTGQYGNSGIYFGDSATYTGQPAHVQWIDVSHTLEYNSDGVHIFKYSNSEIFRTTGTNIGMGVTGTPAAKLDILNSGLALNVYSAQSTGIKVRGGGNSNDIAQFYNISNAAAMVLDSNAQLGIGTSDPQAELHVQSLTNQAPTIRLNHNSSYPSWMIEATANNSASPPRGQLRWDANPGATGMQLIYWAGYSENSLKLDGTNFIVKTQGSEKMRIDSSGDVGIGTTSPGEKLEVEGHVKAVDGYKGYVSHFHSGGFDHLPKSSDGANPFWIPSNYIVDASSDQYYNIWVPLYAGRIRKIIFKNTTGTPTATVCTFYKRINGITSIGSYIGTVTGGGASGMKVTVDFGTSNFTFNAEDEIQIGFVTGVATQPSLRGVSYQIWYEYNIT